MRKPPKLRNRKVKIEIDLKTMQDVNDLISEFREAKAKAKRTGGGYHVGRRNEKGQVIFNIAFPLEECGR